MGGVALLGLVLALSNRPAVSPEGLPLVNNVNTYQSELARANDLAADAIRKADQGEELTDEDRRKLSRAAPIFDNLNRFWPFKVGPFLYAAKVYYNIGEFDLARDRAQQAVNNERTDEQDRPETERGSAEHKAQLRPVLAEAYYVMALADAAKFDWAKSLESAEIAAAMTPNVPNYIVARAAAKLQTGNAAGARQDLRTALGLQPEHKRAKQLLKLLDADKS